MKKPHLALRKSAGNRNNTAGSQQITHADRIVFPDSGITKGDVAAYYLAVAERILPHLHRRPVSIIRAPEGLSGEIFFQRHALKGMTSGILLVPDPSRNHADFIAIENLGGLMTAAQFGVLEFHGWGATLPKLASPDRVVFDLDPDPNVPFSSVRDAAIELRRLLSEIDLQTFPLVSGGKGIHVIAPLDRSQNWDTIANFASGIAQGLATADPNRYVSVAAKKKRHGKIYIDWLRNRMTATAIVPWSVRARPKAPVAVPITWAELKQLASADAFTMADALKRRDPWKDFTKVRQKISPKVLDYLSGRTKSR